MRSFHFAAGCLVPYGTVGAAEVSACSGGAASDLAAETPARRRSGPATRRSAAGHAIRRPKSPSSANIGTIRRNPRLRRRRSRLAHALVDMRLELGEVVDEQLHQLLRGAVVVVLVGPGRARIENLAV